MSQHQEQPTISEWRPRAVFRETFLCLHLPKPTAIAAQASNRSLPPKAMSRALVAQRVSESLGRLAGVLEAASQ